MSPAKKTAPTRRAAREAVIVGGVRTPFAKSGGAFDALGAADLGRHVMVEAMARTGVSPEDVDEVVMGCAGMPSDAANPARVAALRAGLPVATPALTVQRQCARVLGNACYCKSSTTKSTLSSL